MALAALLWMGAVGWSLFQISGAGPEDWQHPVWTRVGDLTGFAAISADPSQGRHGVMRLLCYAMLFWIAFRAAFDPVRALRMLRAIALFSTALAIYGLVAMVYGNNPILDLDGRAEIVNASFVSRNAYATYAVFGCLANIACYLKSSAIAGHNETPLQRLRNYLESFFAGSWVFLLGAVICLVAVAATQSRAGAGAGLIGLLTLFATHRFRGRGNGIVLTITLIFIIGFVVWTSSSGVTHRFLATSAESHRFAVYPQIIAAILERPWLGHGLGAFHDGFRAYLPIGSAGAEWHLAHSSYLENGFELGLPAAAAFYLALSIIGLRIWQGSRRRRRNRVFTCFALACFMAAAFHAIFDFSLQMPATASLFAMILGIGWAQSLSRSGR